MFSNEAGSCAESPRSSLTTLLSFGSSNTSCDDLIRAATPSFSGSGSCSNDKSAAFLLQALHVSNSYRDCSGDKPYLVPLPRFAASLCFLTASFRAAICSLRSAAVIRGSISVNGLSRTSAERMTGGNCGFSSSPTSKSLNCYAHPSQQLQGAAELP